MRYPQLSVDMTLDIGGVRIALPLDKISERQKDKVRLAKEAGIDIATQGAEVAEKAKEVLSRLRKADNEEGIEMNLFTLKAQQDAGMIDLGEDNDPDGLWWDRIIPNYVSGISLERVGKDRVADSAKKN